MLSPSDAALAARDRAIPGLGLLLDPDALGAAIEGGGVALSGLTIDYVRYKPGRNCLSRFTATAGPGREPLTGYAKAYRADEGVKLEKARQRETTPGPAGVGRLVLPEWLIEVCFLPNDNKLRQLRRLANPRAIDRLSRHLLPAGMEWDGGPLTALNYKPERRYVARLDTVESGPAILRFYSESEYRPERAQLAERISPGVRVPRQLGRYDRRQALAFEWLPGRSLDRLGRGAPESLAALEAAGAMLAEFHASLPAEGLGAAVAPHGRPIDATRDMLSALMPAAGRRVERAAGALRRALSWSAPAMGLIHGDLHTRQIILDGGGVGLIDLDECRPGDIHFDLGMLLAHFERDALEPGGDPDLARALGERFLRGYLSAGGRVDDQRLEAQRAACLFGLLAHYFRRRDPDWPGRIARGLERVELLASAGAVA